MVKVGSSESDKYLVATEIALRLAGCLPRDAFALNLNVRILIGRVRARDCHEDH